MRSDVGPKKLKPVLGPPCSKRGDPVAVPSAAVPSAENTNGQKRAEAKWKPHRSGVPLKRPSVLEHRQRRG